MVELKAKRDQIWRRAKKDSKEWNRTRAIFQQPQANVVGDSGLLEKQESDGKKVRMAALLKGQWKQASKYK